MRRRDLLPGGGADSQHGLLQVRQMFLTNVSLNVLDRFCEPGMKLWLFLTLLR
jgi:hypothetical protein